MSNVYYDEGGRAYIDHFDSNGDFLDTEAISPQYAAYLEQEDSDRRAQEEYLSSSAFRQVGMLVKDIRTTHIAKPPYIAGEWLPAGGRCLLFGSDGVGKSLLATGLADALARGEDWLGFKTTKSRVCYVQLDMSPWVTQERLKKTDWLDGEILLVMGSMANPIEKCKGKEDWIQQIKKFGPDVIIFDTLRQLHEQDEDKSGSSRIVYGALNRMFGKDASLVFIHHSRKDGGAFTNSAQGYRGSSDWRAQMDSAILMRQQRKGRISLQWVKHRTCERPEDLTVEIDPLTLKLGISDKAPAVYAAALLKERPEIDRKEFADILVNDEICARSYAYKVYKRLRS